MLPKPSNMNQLTINTPQTATDMVVVKSNLKSLFLSGDNDPLDVFARLKAASEVIEEVLKDAEVKETVMGEADRWKEKTFDHAGAVWTKKMAGVRYDFSVCMDPLHKDMVDYAKVLSARIKKREDFLKALPEKGEVITNQETGETVLVYPPSKTGSEIVQCKLK